MSLVRALLVRVLVGSGYLHTLNLVSLIGVSWLVWLPACLEPRALLFCAGWKWLPTCREPRALLVCAGWKWLPTCLEPCVLVGVSLVRVSWLEVITCMP